LGNKCEIEDRTEINKVSDVPYFIINEN
jgi:hypothetical protein